MALVSSCMIGPKVESRLRRPVTSGSGASHGIAAIKSLHFFIPFSVRYSPLLRAAFSDLSDALYPFPYLGSPSSPQLEPLSTELVRKAAASFTFRHTCQKYSFCIFPTWATFILQVPACLVRHLCQRSLLARLGFPHSDAPLFS